MVLGSLQILDCIDSGGQKHPKVPPNGHVLSAWGPPTRGPFLGWFLALFLINFGAQNDPQNEPKNDKNEPRNVTKKTTYSKTEHLQDLSKSMALVFQKICEFLHTIDKLYISSFFVIHPCNPPKWSKHVTNMHPETPQNLTNSVFEKTTFFGIDFGMNLTSKMTPNWPQNCPKWPP